MMQLQWLPVPHESPGEDCYCESPLGRWLVRKTIERKPRYILRLVNVYIGKFTTLELAKQYAQTRTEEANAR